MSMRIPFSMPNPTTGRPKTVRFAGEEAPAPKPETPKTEQPVGKVDSPAPEAKDTLVKTDAAANIGTQVPAPQAESTAKPEPPAAAARTEPVAATPEPQATEPSTEPAAVADKPATAAAPGFSCPDIAKLDEKTRPLAETALAKMNENLKGLKTQVLHSTLYNPDTYYPVHKYSSGLMNATEELRQVIKPTAEAPITLVVSPSNLLEKTQLLGVDLRQIKLQGAGGQKASLKGSLLQWGRLHDADLSQVDVTGANLYQAMVSPETKLPEGVTVRKNDLIMERKRLKKLLKPVGEYIGRKTAKPRAYIKGKVDAFKAAYHKKFDGTWIGNVIKFLSNIR